MFSNYFTQHLKRIFINKFIFMTFTCCFLTQVTQSANANPETLFQAFYNEDFNFITNQLSDHNANINEQDTDGWTLLHYAANSNNKNFADFLLCNGANPNIQNNLGATALHITPNPSMIKLLLDHNANHTLECIEGFTPLSLATTIFNPAKARILIEHDKAQTLNKKNALQILTKDTHNALLVWAIAFAIEHENNVFQSVLSTRQWNDLWPVVQSKLFTCATQRFKARNRQKRNLPSKTIPPVRPSVPWTEPMALPLEAPVLEEPAV